MWSSVVDGDGKLRFQIFLVVSLVILFVNTIPLSAQGASTYHVFPQFVDGTLSDGTFYRSTLFATNANAVDASCSYQLYGMSNDRLSPTNSFKLPANGGVIRASTPGNGATFVGGYATVSCD